MNMNSNEGVFNSIVGLNVSTADGNMTIDHCKYVFLTENRGKLILNLQYELDITETENGTATDIKGCRFLDKNACFKEKDNEKCSCETEAKAPMLRFMLDGCDISFAAEAPADMTLAQLLKQCDRIHPDYCACGIHSTDDEPELIFGYGCVDYVRGETGYAECSIDGVNEPECKCCKYLVEASEEGWIGKCDNKNSRFYNCLRDSYNTCEFQEDKDGK